MTLLRSEGLEIINVRTTMYLGSNVRTRVRRQLMHHKKDVAESCLKTLTAIYMLKPRIGGDNRRDAPLYLEVNIELPFLQIYSTLLYSVHGYLRRMRR